METFKNFLVGISVLVMALVIVLITLLIWPFLIGTTSIVLFVLAVFLFIILIFYVIVLVGHLTKIIISAVRNDREL